MRPHLLLVMVCSPLACSGSAGRPARPAQEQTSLLRGERQTSGPLRAASARPRPEAEPEHNPLEGDRLGLDEARLRAQRAHSEGHSEAGLALEDFSHPACSALPREERRSCPLSSVRWSDLREVDGGVELETRDAALDPARLRWQFLCHIAFERAHGGKSCPLGTPGLAVSVIRVRDRMTVRLTSEEPSRVSALRRELKRLTR